MGDIIELAMRAGDPWIRGGLALQCEAEALNLDKIAVREAVYSMNPSQWQEKIYRDWRRLQVAPKEVKSDLRLVTRAVTDSWGQALEHASEELRGQRDLVLVAVKLD